MKLQDKQLGRVDFDLGGLNVPFSLEPGQTSSLNAGKSYLIYIRLNSDTPKRRSGATWGTRLESEIPLKGLTIKTVDGQTVIVENQ